MNTSFTRVWSRKQGQETFAALHFVYKHVYTADELIGLFCKLGKMAALKLAEIP